VQSVDVVVIGAGIAGGFLARHLQRARPELSVLCLEAAPAMTDLKVGESTVEVAAHYMVRRLGLGTYLYQHHLPKNGLRFFFDDADKSLPLEKMSEIGSDHMPFHPSFQLERSALERDLVEMNRQIGVTVELGAKVLDVAIDAASSHVVTFEQNGERREVRCRWVCDATGRRQLLHRKLGNKITKETRLQTGAAWGRYRNVAGLDAVEDEAWRRRARHTSRHLSTNHFMYDGYWIWFIPLAGDLMSIGAVFDKERVAGPRTRDEFEAFVKGHRAARDLMEGAVFEDFQAYAHLPYHADVFFSAERWAVTGEAGAFVDPFYSPGSDFIATANEFIVSMIESEIDGDRAFEEKVDVYNRYYRFKYESTLGIYEKLYPTFGSYELFRLKYLLDFNNYYNLVVWPFMADKLRDVAWLRQELEIADRICQGISVMAGHFAKLSEHLRERGEYFAENEGRWANGLNGVHQLEMRLGPVLDDAYRRAEVDKVFGSVFAAVLARLTGEPSLAKRERVLSELSFPTVTLFKEVRPDSVAAFLRRVAARMTRDLRAELPDAGIERVVLSIEPGSTPEVLGACVGTDQHAAIVARAKALWDAEGQSLVFAAL
jgi:flavin-dependent dehydrogenase